jgi:hypothetical protein
VSPKVSKTRTKTAVKASEPAPERVPRLSPETIAMILVESEHPQVLAAQGAKLRRALRRGSVTEDEAKAALKLLKAGTPAHQVLTKVLDERNRGLFTKPRSRDERIAAHRAFLVMDADRMSEKKLQRKILEVLVDILDT